MPQNDLHRRLRTAATALWRSGLADAVLAWLATYVILRGVNAPLNRETLHDPHLPHLSPYSDWPGFLTVWALLTLTLVVTRQRFTVLAVFGGIGVATFVALRTKLAVLRAPLLPADLAFATDLSFLGDQTSPATVLVPLGLLVVALSVAVWLDRRRRRAWRRALSATSRRHRRLISLALVPVLLLGVAQVLDFNRGPSLVRELYGDEPVLCCGWSQRESYVKAGFVAGFLGNLPSTLMEEPAGYSREAVEEIARRYSDDLPDIDGTLRLSDYHVVTVLSESFADPTALDGLTFSRDPLAAFREVGTEGWTGSTVAAAYGSGTSAMEFQVLTGQTLSLISPGIISPYQSYLGSVASFPSLVGWLRSYGFGTTAIHAFHGEFYKRRDVYPMLGFEEFIEAEHFTHRDHAERNQHLSDAATFAEALDVLEASDGPSLVHLVTMQNHQPFDDWYDDPPRADGLVGTPEEASALDVWLGGLEHSSEALRDFLDDLRGLERPTLVIYYGDHYPAVLSADALTANPGSALRTTPVLLWASTGAVDPGRDLGTVGAYNLVPLAARMVGAPLPPYYRFLEHVRAELGVVAGGRVIAPDGTELTEDDLSAAQQDLLQDYRIVQYDLSVGQRYGLEALWYGWTP